MNGNIGENVFHNLETLAREFAARGRKVIIEMTAPVVEPTVQVVTAHGVAVDRMFNHIHRRNRRSR